MKKNKEDGRAKIIIWTLVTLFAMSFFAAGLLSLFLLDSPSAGNVAKIYINGVIAADSIYGDTISTDIIAFIRDAENDPRIKGIVFEINSPGGSAVASHEIVEAVKRTNKTTVALIREVGASGAYWVASATDEIIASPLSVTGSIGVIGSYLEFSGLLARYNVTYERLVAGEYKDMGSPMKKLTPNERRKLEGQLEEIHRYFIEDVSRNRNISANRMRELATGEIFIGSSAQKHGLIDTLLPYDSVDEYLEKRLNITEITYSEYIRKRTFLDVLSRISADFGFSVGKGIGSGIRKDDMAIRT